MGTSFRKVAVLILALIVLCCAAPAAMANDAFAYQKLTPTGVTMLHQPTAASAFYALVAVEGASVRYTVHGVDPTSGGAKVGNILYDRDTLWLIGGEIKAFRVIQTTPGNGAEVRVTFYK